MGVDDEVSLLQYVIAYLQEEMDRVGSVVGEAAPEDESAIRILVDQAIDAYANGAR